MRFKEVDERTKEIILDRRRGVEITEMLHDFVKSNLPVAQVDENDVAKYKNPTYCRQTLDSSMRNFNKRNNAFLQVVTNHGKVFLINRSISTDGN